jgi:hypothetical protein
MNLHSFIDLQWQIYDDKIKPPVLNIFWGRKNSFQTYDFYKMRKITINNNEQEEQEEQEKQQEQQEKEKEEQQEKEEREKKEKEEQEKEEQEKIDNWIFL